MEIRARGRNGNFRVAEVSVSRYTDGTTSIRLYSKKRGGEAPIVIVGTSPVLKALVGEVESMLGVLDGKSGAIFKEIGGGKK